MMLSTNTLAVVASDDLGKALAEAPPAEFAATWVAFTDSLDQQDGKESDRRLDAFAVEMASRGGRNVHTLRTLLRLVDFHLESRFRSSADKPAKD